MAKRKENNDHKQHYVNKIDLREELIACKKSGVVSPSLEAMFIKIVDGVALHFSNLEYFGVLDDIKQDCLLLLVQKYQNFDPNKRNDRGTTTSSFAFLTSIVFNQMRYQASKTKRYRDKLHDLNQRIITILEAHEGEI